MVAVVSHDWKISHSYTTDELKFEDELSVLRSFKFRLYDGAGNYVDIGYQRNGSDLDAMQVIGGRRMMLVLPNIMLFALGEVAVGGTYCKDLKISAVWKKGLGVKTRIKSESVSVGIKITSNATITEEVAGSQYSAGNLRIKVLSGSASLNTGNNVLTITGSDVHITVGIGSYFDAEDSFFGIANEDMNLTATAPSSGIKITVDVLSEVVYFRWDALPKIYELYHSVGFSAAWFVVSNNGKKLALIQTALATGQKSSNFINTGFHPGFGWRTSLYIPSDSVVSETYQPLFVPSRVVWLFSGDVVGFVYEGSCYRATGDKIADIVYAKTIDLANEKALITRYISATASFTTYQEGGATVSLGIEGTIDGDTPDEWGYKYWDGSSWVEVTSLPSGWRYDNSLAMEMKRRTDVRYSNYSLIAYAVSLKTSLSVTMRAALAGDTEAYLYPQISGEAISTGDYLKEIYVAFYGNASDYGTTLESKVTVPSSLDSKDFNKTLNDLSDAQAYGFDTAVIYDPSTDTYTLALTSAQAPKFTIIDYPSSVNVQPNDSFTVKVTVKNEGSASGTVKVQLKDHNGNVVDYKNVSIGAGEVWTVELSATAPAEEGAYTWTVEAYNIDTETVDDSKTITVNVSQALYLLGSIFDMLIQLLPYLIMLIIIVLIISLVISATR